MKIVRIEVSKINIPMKRSYRNSAWNVTEKPTLIIKIQTADGITSYGETSGFTHPFYKMDTIDISLLALCDYIIPLVLHKDFLNTELFSRQLHTVIGCNFAKAGIENAFVAARALEKNLSLKQLINGTRDKIPVGESVDIKDTIEDVLEEVGTYLDEGFQRIKIKIGPGWDVEVVKRIRETYGNIPLMVDANGIYTPNDAHILKELDGYDLMMMEQPLAHDDIVDHSILQKDTRTPICLDESILSWHDARKALYLGACQIINIKPVRVAGLWESRLIHDYCANFGVGVWCGGMAETTIGRAFNLALATLPNYVYPADMTPPARFYEDDVTIDTYAIDKDGYAVVPDKPGMGFEVDERKIKKYTVQRFVFS